MKIAKKVGAVGLSAAILLSAAGPAFANEAAGSAVSSDAAVVSMPPKDDKPVNDGQTEAKIPRDKAVELAKSFVQIPENYVLQNVSFNSSQIFGSSNVSSYWQIEFAKKDQKDFYGSINVTINSDTGELSNFGIYDSDPDKQPAYPPKTNLQSAKQIAADYLAKMNPGEKDQVRYNMSFENSFKTPLHGDVRYELKYERIVNDIVYPDNYISFSINGDGKIMNYSKVWDDKLSFEDAKGLINADAAKKTFLEQSRTVLAYLIPYDAQTKTPVISYQFSTSPLDAKSGKWIDSRYGFNFPDMGDNKPLTDKPLANPPAENLSLTKEQAVEKVKSYVTLPDKATLEDASYNESIDRESGKQRSSWNLRWTLKGEKDQDTQYIWASVNSKTGELLNYNRNQYIAFSKESEDGTTPEPAVKRDNAEQLAADFVKKTLPQYTHQLVQLKDDSSGVSPYEKSRIQDYSVRFVRVIDGVVASSDSVYINVSANSGDITYFSSNFSDIAYPAKQPKVITPEQARELNLERYDIQLRYLLDDSANYGGMPIEKYNLMVAAGEIMPGQQPSAGSEPAKAKPVYVLVDKYNKNVFLDAASGTWKKSDTGVETNLANVTVTDIEGHWAQNALQLMLDYEALDVKDGKVSPDASITRGEMIKMLTISLNGGRGGFSYDSAKTASFADVRVSNEYFAYVERAVDLNLIDRSEKNFNPDSTVTREELAKMIVRALGYNKLSGYDSIFALSADDAVDIQNKGQVAIVTGLGIMTLSDGKFQPKQEVNRAQAATAFYRFLEKRSAIQDRPQY